MFHVWYIDIHLAEIYGKCRQIFKQWFSKGTIALYLGMPSQASPQSPEDSEHCHDEFINQECLVIFWGSRQQVLLLFAGKVADVFRLFDKLATFMMALQVQQNLRRNDTLLYCSSSYSMIFQSNRRMIKTWCKFHVVSMISGSFPQVSYARLLSNEIISKHLNSRTPVWINLPILSKENSLVKTAPFPKMLMSASHTNVLRTSPVYVRNSFK